MGRDERVPSIAVDVGVESNLPSCGRDLGDSSRAHDLKWTGKTPCVTGRRAQVVNGWWSRLGDLFEVGASRSLCGVVSWVLCEGLGE